MKVAIGQDSHRFNLEAPDSKPLILGGVLFEGEPALIADSDGDVVLHAITRAVSGITTVEVLGGTIQPLVKQGITDSRIYLQEALKDLKGSVSHLSVSIECRRPRVSPKIAEMRRSIASLLGTAEANIGITASSGEGLTDVGRGLGINVLAVLTVFPETS